MDIMSYRYRNKQSSKLYFLTWTSESCHDMDEWVGIATSLDKLQELYRRAKEKDNMDASYYQNSGLELEAYEYEEGNGFTPINIKWD